MAKTVTNLYRSVMDKRFTIEACEYPGDGVLDPRWAQTTYIDKKGVTRTSQADVVVIGDEVEAGGGTSLHNVPSWFSAPDFWIPEGTDYSDVDIHISRDSKETTSPYNRQLKGTHFQLEPKYRMPVASFQGALNNMARAAVVQQIAQSKGKAKT
jgi:hypothetical protein